MSVLGKKHQSGLRWRKLDAVRASLAGMPGERDYCHACRGESLAVHPDGAVYPCAQTIGDPLAAVGTIACVDWDRLRGFYGNIRMEYQDERRLRRLSAFRTLSRRLSFPTQV